MKKLATLTFAGLISVAAFSATDTRISDLMYTPGKGKFRYQMESRTYKSEFDVKSSTGTISQNTENSHFDIDQEFIYGLTDNFHLGVNVDWVAGNSNETTPNPGTNTTPNKEFDNTGLEEIGLIGRWRYWQNNDLRTDAIFGLAPKLGDSEDGDSNTTNSSDGNAYHGGNIVELGTEIGNTPTGKFLWKAGLDVVYNGERDVENKPSTAGGTTTNNTWEPSTDFQVRGEAQYAFTDLYRLNAGAAVAFVGEQEAVVPVQTGVTTAYTQTYESHTDVSLTLTNKFDFTQDIMAAIGIDYVIRSDFDQSTKVGNATPTTSTLENENETQIFGRFDIAF